VFDHPTPAAVAEYLVREASGAERAVAPARAAAPRLDEPIAIVGMSCRFPGGVRSPEELWELRREGRDAIGESPATAAGTSSGSTTRTPTTRARATRARRVRRGRRGLRRGVLRISPREALAMDPQQRLLLEAAWEALEHAGHRPGSLRGTDGGRLRRASLPAYATRGGRPPPELEGYLATGTPRSVVSGRIAYALGLEGPAVTVDTACSSSLVALHWRRRRCARASARWRSPAA
jgi:acyl transferase domain-containing protein